MKGKISFREIVFDSLEYHQELDLRERVLRKPLGRKHTKEELAQDHERLHLGAFIENNIVACLCFVDRGNSVAQMRAVAVDPNVQGQGLGSKLVKFSEFYIQNKNFKEIILNARETALDFYKKMGYEICSEKYDEIGIPHYKMRKSLGPVQL